MIIALLPHSRSPSRPADVKGRSGSTLVSIREYIYAEKLSVDTQKACKTIYGSVLMSRVPKAPDGCDHVSFYFILGSTARLHLLVLVNDAKHRDHMDIKICEDESKQEKGATPNFTASTIMK